MKVHIRNPDREVDGPRRVRDLLTELDIDPDTVLVIRDGTLITRRGAREDGDRVEIRPVISGGAQPEPQRGSTSASKRHVQALPGSVWRSAA